MTKLEKLEKLLWELEYDEEVKIPNEQNNVIEDVISDADEYGLVDEMLEIVENRTCNSLLKVCTQIFDMGYLPECQIVDDDELDEDERNSAVY